MVVMKGVVCLACVGGVEEVFDEDCGSVRERWICRSEEPVRMNVPPE